ncbi:Fe3+-hydroxamate ABC transporter substrate-binding protein [Paenibacillus donghaensis]|uniref:Fe3+-hydroxamate ABC transporter substrate-binding protein n=2 Tax=Paenibacillus donghaensis TaxID=414771 RepID=A0A2Z2K2U8_9BACL|nr:Fe3+-hydroxamate ABC transporter substrate-binding protein [Paenibacillus donghaensis]
MQPEAASPVPLHSLAFQLMDIALFIQPEEPQAQQQAADSLQHYRLLVVTGGSGSLSIENEVLAISADKCCLLSPGESFRLQSDGTTLYYYMLAFTAVSLQERPEWHTAPLLPGRRELIAYPFTRLLSLTEELFHSKQADDPIRLFRQQLKFQELLLFLLEHNLPSTRVFSPAQSVEATVHYIRGHYDQDITVKQLARLANVPSWQYSAIFQKLTGIKPLDFVTTLRIEHAKPLLLHSGEPLREIARKVGYADEYYFSRRFRQKTGESPGQYALSRRQKLRVTDWMGHAVDIPERPKRIVYHGETLGDLLALGVRPVGSDEAFSRNSVYKHRIKKLANVGFPLDIHRTGKLHPDLIIIATPDEQAYEQVAALAPTLSFNSFAPLDERLQVLGRWLGKEQEAAAWLDSFAAKNTLMWQRLSPGQLLPGETATALTCEHGSRLYAMGASGLAPALYADGGFQPPDKIKPLLKQGLGFIEVSLIELPLYAGDRLFVLLPEREDSKVALEQLMAGPLWRSLPAVQSGRVHLLDGARWNCGDALTREKFLGYLPKLLTAAPAQ